MLKAGEYGIISRVSFSSSRGSVISMCRYREMIYGEGCEELELSRIGEIIGIAKAIDVVEADDSKLDISVESRVPPEKTIGKARKSLKIQVFLVVRSSFFARQIPLVFYSSLDWEMSEQEKSSRDPPKESMTSDSTPVFALEKEALKTEIETGLQVGVDHLEDKPMKRKPVEKYHNTRYLLKQYRKVAYAIQISESDMNVRMEMEHGTRLSTLEVNAELAGVDLSGSKLEGYARTVIRSKNMLQIIKNALNTVRLDPDHGELMYQILYLTYFSERKLANREAILAELERIGFQMSMVTYHSYLNMAIKAIDRILWGYTARDCMEIIKQFLP